MSALDVLRALGFEVVGTGGGCEALYFERPDGESCMVTNDLAVPTEFEDWEVGIYAPALGEYDGQLTGEPLYQYTYRLGDGLLEALAVIAAWRVG